MIFNSSLVMSGKRSISQNSSIFSRVAWIAGSSLASRMVCKASGA